MKHQYGFGWHCSIFTTRRAAHIAPRTVRQGRLPGACPADAPSGSLDVPPGRWGLRALRLSTSSMSSVPEFCAVGSHRSLIGPTYCRDRGLRRSVRRSHGLDEIPGPDCTSVTYPPTRLPKASVAAFRDTDERTEIRLHSGEGTRRAGTSRGIFRVPLTFASARHHLHLPGVLRMGSPSSAHVSIPALALAAVPALPHPAAGGLLTSSRTGGAHGPLYRLGASVEVTTGTTPSGSPTVPFPGVLVHLRRGAFQHGTCCIREVAQGWATRSSPGFRHAFDNGRTVRQRAISPIASRLQRARAGQTLIAQIPFRAKFTRDGAKAGGLHGNTGQHPFWRPWRAESYVSQQ